MTWALNPFALAERILDKPLGGSDWSTATEYLREAFNVDPVQLFDTVNGEQPLMDMMRQLEDAVTSPRSIDEVMQLAAVKRVQALLKLSDDAVRRLLPYVVPVSDVGFAAPGAAPGGEPHPATAGTYHAAGPIITGDVSFLDPKQGSVADCYLVASMISLAWAAKDKWRSRIQKAWHEAPVRGMDIAFFKTRTTSFPEVAVSAMLPDDANGKTYTIGRDGSEAWPGMIEKAFVRQQTPGPGEPTPADFKAIDNEMEPHEACAMLLAGTRNKKGEPGDPGPSRASKVRDRCNAQGVTESPTMIWTYPPSSKTGGVDLAPEFKPSTMGLHRDHAYAVLGTMKQIKGGGAPVSYIVLRNPWGTAPQPAVFATGTWSKNDNGREDVLLNSDGVFAVEEATFDVCCMSVGWVELE